MRWAAALLLCAGPAGAGCFTADGMPAKAHYDNGSVVEYVARDGEVLTYRSDKVESRMQSGVWSLESSAQGKVMVRYTWDAPLPDLKAIAAAGGKAQSKGRIKMAGVAEKPVLVEVEILGQSTLDWEDCRYDVVELRKTTTVGTQKPSVGVILFAPAPMIFFRTTTVDPNSGKSFSYALEVLE